LYFDLTSGNKNNSRDARIGIIRAKFMVLTIPTLSAILPIRITVAAAVPPLAPITIEEARLTLRGNISCTTLIHKGRVEVINNPARINKIIDTIRGVVNIK